MMAQAAPLDNEPQPSVSWLILERLSDINKRMDGIERRIDGFDRRIDGFDRRIDGFDRRMDGFDRRMDALEAQIDREMGSIRNWTLALAIPSFGLMAGILAKLFV